MLSNERKQEICRVAMDKAGALMGGRIGCCLYAAHYVAEQLWETGVPALIQAGTMAWPRIDLATDDGTNPTSHFSYEWQGWPASRIAYCLVRGMLPEMHVWVGIHDSQECVDATAGTLAEAVALAGLEWTAPPPPEFLWASAPLPNGVAYVANRDATLLAYSLLENKFSPNYCEAYRASRGKRIAAGPGRPGVRERMACPDGCADVGR